LEVLLTPLKLLEGRGGWKTGPCAMQLMGLLEIVVVGDTIASNLSAL